jgi:hypothetical protein
MQQRQPLPYLAIASMTSVLLSCTYQAKAAHVNKDIWLRNRAWLHQHTMKTLNTFELQHKRSIKLSLQHCSLNWICAPPPTMTMTAAVPRSLFCSRRESKSISTSSHAACTSATYTWQHSVCHNRGNMRSKSSHHPCLCKPVNGMVHRVCTSSATRKGLKAS